MQSFHIGEDSHKPFHVNLGSDTIERYQQVWSKLLIYVLRTANSETQLYQLTESQQTRVDNLLLAANQATQYISEELEEEEVEAMDQKIDKSCLHLCIALLDHRLDHDEYESAIVSYLAVAALQHIPGDDPNQYKFKDASEYTSILSGFIKIAQMLTVQYCLEEEESGEVVSCRELLEQVHTRFLVVSTATPMDWVLRLRLYGRGIGRKTTAVGYVNWVGETVIYKEMELSMSDFRQLVHKLYDETHHILLNDLLFANDSSKFSFLSMYKQYSDKGNMEVTIF